jgi:GT2 family glycosyltransferase
MTAPRVSAIVLAYRDEPWLERCVDALAHSEGVDVDVVLVDNGCTDGGVDRVRGRPGVQIVGSGDNLGFSGGCNLGVAASSGAYVALVNGDLIVEPDALARLVAVAAERDVGIAAGSVRLAEDAGLLNSAGNEIHFLGFSWVGGFGEPASVAARDRDVAGAMGALVVMRRDAWDALGGFAPEYFAFHEDAELSWRSWQRGWRVHYVPEAIGLHRYEFDREPRKLYLAERNRWLFVLTCWEARTLLLIAPAFLAVEIAVAAASVHGGWWRDKVAGWRWCWTHRRWLRERRAAVQAARTVSDRRLASLMSEHLDARNFPIPDALRPLDALLAAYWRFVRRLLR